MFPVAPSPRALRSRRGPTGPARAGAAACAASLLLATGCGVLAPEFSDEMTADINVTSSMMQERGPLPEAYTCHGEGYSPPLEWSGLPANDIGSIAVVVDEPQRATVFWVLYDLDPQIHEIRQNTVPQSARQGENSLGQASYSAPCPEEGAEYEYRFTVYALRGEVDLPEGAALAQSLEAIADQALARGSLITTNAPA